MTAAVTPPNNLFKKFEMLALRDDKVASAKSKSTKGNKVQIETSASSAENSSARPPKKMHRNRGGKKKGKKKNTVGAKPPAVVVEISEATVVPSINRKSSNAGKNKKKKKNSNKKKEPVAAAQDAENIPDNIHYGLYEEGYHPEQHYHDPGYYYQYYGYYQNYDYGYAMSEDAMAYYYQYGNMPMAMADQTHALNSDAPTFQPQQY